jgi:hypothetical protein
MGIDWTGDTLGPIRGGGGNWAPRKLSEHELPPPIHPEVLARLDEIHPFGFDDSLNDRSPRSEERRLQIEAELGIDREAEKAARLAELQSAAENLAESSDNVSAQYEQ